MAKAHSRNLFSKRMTSTTLIWLVFISRTVWFDSVLCNARSIGGDRDTDQCATASNTDGVRYDLLFFDNYYLDTYTVKIVLFMSHVLCMEIGCVRRCEDSVQHRGTQANADGCNNICVVRRWWCCKFCVWHMRRVCCSWLHQLSLPGRLYLTGRTVTAAGAGWDIFPLSLPPVPMSLQ